MPLPPPPSEALTMIGKPTWLCGYRGYIGDIYWGYVGDILGIYWGYIGDVLGINWDNGKENGNYYLGFKVYSFGFRAV